MRQRLVAKDAVLREQAGRREAERQELLVGGGKESFRQSVVMMFLRTGIRRTVLLPYHVHSGSLRIRC